MKRSSQNNNLLTLNLVFLDWHSENPGLSMCLKRHNLTKMGFKAFYDNQTGVVFSAIHADNSASSVEKPQSQSSPSVMSSYLYDVTRRTPFSAFLKQKVNQNLCLKFGIKPVQLPLVAAECVTGSNLFSIIYIFSDDIIHILKQEITKVNALHHLKKLK
ncbi:unnamed protein product [Knipowitschia caucasica]